MIICLFVSLSIRYIAPAIFVDVQEDDSLMTQELFGPILPIIVVNGIDQAIQFVNKRLV